MKTILCCVTLACVVITLLTTPAPARDLTLILNDADQQTLVAALDAMMKAQGLTSLTNGTAGAVQSLFQKLQAAAQAPEPAKEISK